MVKLSIVICQLSIVAACTKADIHYPTIETAQGMVMIYPDQSGYTLPALEYHFYNVDTQIEYIVRSCDGSGNFEGTIPVGTYRVIATNTDAQNVEFGDMQNCDLATVTALPVFTRSTAQQMVNGKRSMVNQRSTIVNYLAQPGEVYSTVINSLAVSDTDTLCYEPAPVLLTKQLKLVFTLAGDLETEVTALTGVLHGIFSSVHLYTCIHTQESAVQSPSMAITFNTAPSGNQRATQVSLFGLADPEYGTVYTNQLPLELTLVNGNTEQVTLNLTDVLSDIIYQNQGVIPLELTVPITIERVDVGLQGIVTGWHVGGETTTDY